MIRSAQDERVAGRQVFEYLRGTGQGAVHHLGGARNDINAMGNLETIPPYEYRSKKYPAGRIIQGTHGTMKPFILEYLQAQEMQDPILLDTDWLAVGHVDEFIQFLPANSTRGWVMLVADPNAGLNLLKKAQASGHGATRAYSRKNDTVGNPSDLFGTPGGLRGVPSNTIDEVLSQKNLILTNAQFAKRINANVRLLQKKTGITDEEIHSIPLAFRTGLIFSPGFGIDSSRNGSSTLGGALYPGIINGVILSNNQYLAPNPWGPVVDGKDIIATAVADIYAKLGFKAIYIDDWNSHHTWGGEVHCATNTIRDASAPWW
jgi:protein-arginine deiminase